MTQFVEVPATKRSLTIRRKVLGVGVNDANYKISLTIGGKTTNCPFYQKWRQMLTRCYSKNLPLRRRTYVGCSVVEEWLLFSVFKAWMKTQDWEGKQLDKDIIIPGNKVYGPESCVFISQSINNLLNTRVFDKSEIARGVSWNHNLGKYQAHCSVNSKSKGLGYFKSEDRASIAYLEFKSLLVLEASDSEEAMANIVIRNSLINHSKILSDSAKELADKINGEGL